MTIFDKLTAILSALDLSTAKLYSRIRKNNRSEEGKAQFVKNYVDANLKEEIENRLSEIHNDFADYEAGRSGVRWVSNDMIAEILHLMDDPAAIKEICSLAKYCIPYSKDELASMEVQEIIDALEYEPDEVAEAIVEKFIRAARGERSDQSQEDWLDYSKTYRDFKARWIRENTPYIREELETEALEKYEENEGSYGEIDNEDYSGLFGNKDRIMPPELRFKASDFAMSSGVNNRDRWKFNRMFEKLAIVYFDKLGKGAERDALRMRFEKSDADAYNGDRNYFETLMYTFQTDPKRSIAVGKILSFLSNKDDVVEDEGEILNWLNQMISKRSKSKKNVELVTVISRHPYDIAGMSTGRGWTSCMNLHTGSNMRYVGSSIAGGVLIAYLCRSDDTTDIVDSKGTRHKNAKINIQNPLGRVLIKPYKNNDGKGNRILIASEKYGTYYDEAIKKLQEWLDYNWNSVHDTEDDDFDFDPRFYHEAKDKQYYVRDMRGAFSRRLGNKPNE